MTNEEKANEIVFGWSDGVQNDAYDAALEMAKWKEVQFKTYLENRLKEYKDSIHTEIDAYDFGYTDAIKEIINEFFN